ncbi:MAG: pilus assembly protein [Alphaproteobacteria bacterium]|nr:pilus assembly protein [Alphaproteobacteria bacterium]
MAWKNRIRTAGARMLRDEGGNVLMFVGLGMFALVGATGVAVDMSRLQSAQTKLSNALDSAGLAAGSKAHSANVQQVVNNYMAVNYPPGFLDSTLMSTTATVSQDNTVITLSATARVPMTFMQIFGTEYMDVVASSEITRENKGLELVMALDVTGSMAGTKITDLRSAATDMVNILFGDKATMENLYVAVVPYVTTVNIGSDKTAWLRNYDLSRYPAQYPAGAVKWKGCVESRTQYPVTNGLDLTDAIPEAGKPETLFPMYFWESNTVQASNAHNNPWITKTTTTKNGKTTTTTTVTLNEGSGYTDAAAKGPNVGCGTPITPFTTQKATVQSAIDALVPWRRGGTMSSEGMAWAWRVISPKWRGMWGNPDLPLDYNTPLMSKAVIMMTDGVNEIYTGVYPYLGSDYTSYGHIQQKKMGNTVDTTAEGITAVNSKFASICTAMKAQNIIIYTVTFQLNNSTASNNARTMFRNCASKPEYYFDSPDGATLRQSFRQIGDSLANLMISR